MKRKLSRPGVAVLCALAPACALGVIVPAIILSKSGEEESTTIELVEGTNPQFKIYDKQVLLKPNIQYKAVVKSMGKWGIGGFAIASTDYASYYPFNFVPNSAKHNGNIITTAQYISEGNMVFLGESLTSGSFEISFSVNQECAANVVAFEGGN